MDITNLELNSINTTNNTTRTSSSSSIVTSLPPLPPPGLSKQLKNKQNKQQELSLFYSNNDYNEQLSSRRVIFQAAPPDPIYMKPRNVIIEWEIPTVTIKQQIRHLGEIRANPIKYASKYNKALTPAKEMPQFILDIQEPKEHNISTDLNEISEIQPIKSLLDSTPPLPPPPPPSQSIQLEPISLSKSSKSAIDEIFRLLYNKENGRIKVNRAARVVLKVNSRLGRKYGETDVKHFIRALDVNGDGTLSLNEFRQAFTTLVL